MAFFVQKNAFAYKYCCALGKSLMTYSSRAQIVEVSNLTLPSKLRINPKISSAITLWFLQLAGNVTTYILGGESYAFNSTHDAWCENDKILSNNMFVALAVPYMYCRPSQFMINKKNNYFNGALYVNPAEDPLKNFFVCQWLNKIFQHSWNLLHKHLFVD
jgi:hypothetical protein